MGSEKDVMEKIMDKMIRGVMLNGKVCINFHSFSLCFLFPFGYLEGKNGRTRKHIADHSSFSFKSLCIPFLRLKQPLTDSSFFSNSNSTSSSSSLGRMRTCSDSSSIFTFKSTSSSSTFTSSSSSSGSSTSETCTEVDTSPVRSHARDEIFYTPTALRHRHEGYPGHEDSTSDHKTGGDHHAFPEPHSSSSFTFNPLSDTFQTGLNFEDDFPSFKLGTPFFNDGYKTEDLAKDKMNDYIDCRASHQEEGLQLQEGEGQEREEDGEDQEDEDEDDFPLSVLEKNIMGLIDEPIFSSSNLSIFPSPPSPPSSASGKIFSSPLVVESPISSKRDSQQRKDYSKEEEEDRFSPFRHLSPLPLTTQTPIKNALESFEKKLEVSKKASYPFLLSSSSSLSTASSPFFPSTAQRQDEQLFKPKDEEIGSKRERKSASAFSTSSISEVSDFPVCRCGCGEQHQLGISSGTPTFGSGDFSPFLSKSLPLGHHQQRFPSHCDVISSGARTAPIHKSIWSIASPPTSPTKVKVAQASLGHRVAHPISSTSSSFNFDESDHQHMKYSRGSSSSTFPTYTPTAEYFPRSPFAGNYPEATFNDDDSFSSYSSPFGPKPSLKRTVSSCLPLNGEDVHSYSPRSFEQGHNDRLAPSPQHYHHQHTHSYPTYSSAAAGPPRHAHPHFLSHHQTYARQNLNGPSPNNKKGELYKTEVCRSWSEIGNCRYGKKCQFAHGLQELRSMSMSMHHGDGGYGGGDGAGGSPCSPAIMCGSNAGRFGYSSERMHMPNSGSHASLSDPWSSSNTGRPGGMSHTLSPFGRHDYKLHTFEDVRGSRSGMEAVGVGAGGRRRSVSSPSKIRMYSLARQEEEACKMDFSIWNHDAFDSNVSHLHVFL